MGFFSSIGSVLGGIGGAILGGPAGAVIGSGLAGAVGGGVDTLRQHNYYSDQMDFARSQDAFNRQYVQNAIQWRVEDAKKAGVHPMAALGFQSPGYSGVSMPSIPGDSSTIDPMEFGQSLNYAAAKAKTQGQQEQAFDLTKQGMELDNQGKQIQNEIAATQLLSMQAQLRNSGPSAPSLTGKETLIEGQNDSPPKDLSILGKDSLRLFRLAMHGNTALLVLNPDISDAISESMVNNTIASIVREVESGENHELIDEIISHFPKHIRKAISDGEMRLASIPGSGAFRAVPVGPDESFDRYNVFGIN